MMRVARASPTAITVPMMGTMMVARVAASMRRNVARIGGCDSGPASRRAAVTGGRRSVTGRLPAFHAEPDGGLLRRGPDEISSRCCRRRCATRASGGGCSQSCSPRRARDSGRRGSGAGGSPSSSADGGRAALDRVGRRPLDALPRAGPSLARVGPVSRVLRPGRGPPRDPTGDTRDRPVRGRWRNGSRRVAAGGGRAGVRRGPGRGGNGCGAADDLVRELTRQGAVAAVDGRAEGPSGPADRGRPPRPPPGRPV